MYRRLTHNWTLKLTALVLAIALWSHVRGQVNPWEVASFKVRLAAQAPDGYVLQNPGTLPAFVTIMIRGPRLTLRQIKGSTPANPLAGAEDAPLLNTRRVRAFLDFSSPQRGEQKVPVKVETNLEDVEFVGARPAEIPVALDVAARRSVPVEAQFDLPSSWRVTKSVLNPRTVQVSGASRTLERIVAVRARVTSKVNSPGTLTFDRVPLVAVDEEDDIIKGVTIEPDEVQINASVAERLDEKSVPVKVRVTGTPARGYELGTAAAEPSSVTIRGARRVLANIESLAVDVDVNGAREEIRKRIRLSAPAGTEIISPRRIRVHIAIMPPTVPASVGSTPAAGQAGAGVTLTPENAPSALPQPAPNNNRKPRKKSY